MSQLKVLTPLAQDYGTINLLSPGHPILVIVSSVAEGGSSPNSQLVTASASSLLTGSSSTQCVRVDMSECGDHVVTFDPIVREKEDYALTVLFDGEHVPGSPYFLRYVEPLAFSSVYTERRHAVTDARKTINFIVPLEKSGELDASVEGPFGPCRVDVNYFSLDEAQESVSVRFEPKGTGAYSIDLRVDREEVRNGPFLILADFSSEEARKCRVLVDDEHLFKKRLRFRGNGEGTLFRVSTQAALEVSSGPGELSVLCSGPKKAIVRLSRDPERRGVERCEVVPSTPGDYRLSVLWKGQLIGGSPHVLHFRRPRGRIVADGLFLHRQAYRLEVPYRFKLDCSDFEGGAPDVACEPDTACSISVTPVQDAAFVYACEITPKHAGTHSLGMKFRGKDIGGSPFQVKFEDPCNPAACRIVEGSKTCSDGGVLGLKITTEGAGPGTLEATAEAPGHTAVSLTVEKLAQDMYWLEFQPGQSVECYLHVTFSKRQIPGSPFKLVFSNPENFVVEGDGLLGGHVGTWNSFTVQVIDPLPGALQVNVEREDGFHAQTIVMAVTELEFEVQYLPTSPGKYTIDAKWGQFPLPGTPFPVVCSSAVCHLGEVPKKAEVGSKLSFEVRVDGEEAPLDSLQVFARTSNGGRLRGKTTPVEKEGQKFYLCSLVPQVPGNCMVAVKWNKVDVEGSPFSVKVVPLPQPWNVRVFGRGVERGEVGGAREFTIDTSRAGGGILGVRIRGPTKELKFSMRQDTQNKRTLHVKYIPAVPGRYLIKVQWAGKHVPGSPFNVDVLPLSPPSQPELEEGKKQTVVAEVHPLFVARVHPELTVVDVETLGKTLEEDSSFQSQGSVLQDECRNPTPSRSPNHISIYVEDRDSVRKELCYDAEVQFFKCPTQTSPDSQSLQSTTSSSSSLYSVMQMQTRRASGDEIAIHLGAGEVPLLT